MSEDKQSLAKQEKETTDISPPQPSMGARRQRSVFVYLAIMFAAAFLLLLFAYLMQQRNSEEIMGNLNELRDSVTSIESIDDVLAENRTLREGIESLREEKSTLEDQCSDLENQITGLTNDLAAAQDEAQRWENSFDEAMNVVEAFHIVAEVQNLCEQDSMEEAKTLVESLEQIDGKDFVEYYLTYSLSRYSDNPDYLEILETFPPLNEWRELKESLGLNEEE